MACNRRDCPHPGPHVHLRPCDERAIADVLVMMIEERRGGIMIVVPEARREARDVPG